MEEILRLIEEIRPSITTPGVNTLAWAIWYAKDAISQPLREDPIPMLKHVYIPAALKAGKSQAAGIKAISRFTKACWLDGKNQRLNEIIGKVLPVRPSPRDFVLYCAYYIAFGKPCHGSDGPLIF